MGRVVEPAYAEARPFDASTINAQPSVGRPRSRRGRPPTRLDRTGRLPRGPREYAVVTCSTARLSRVLCPRGPGGASFVEPGKRIGSDLVTIRDDGATPRACRCGSTRGCRQATGRPGRSGCYVAGWSTTARRPLAPASTRPAWSTGRQTRTVRPVELVMEPGTALARRPSWRAGIVDSWSLVPLHEPGPPQARVVTGMTRDGTSWSRAADRWTVQEPPLHPDYLTAWLGPWPVGRERKTLRGFLGGVVVPAVRIETGRSPAARNTDQGQRRGPSAVALSRHDPIARRGSPDRPSRPRKHAQVFDVDALRSEFPALGREHDGRPSPFLDGPGGRSAGNASSMPWPEYYRDMTPCRWTSRRAS